jgi:hypothetical protein
MPEIERLQQIMDSREIYHTLTLHNERVMKERAEQRAEKAEAECAVLRDALVVAVREGRLEVVWYDKLDGERVYFCTKCARQSPTTDVQHPEYCPVPSLHQALANTHAGKQAAEVLRAAEEWRRLGKDYLSFGRWESVTTEQMEQTTNALVTAVDAYRSQREGGAI